MHGTAKVNAVFFFEQFVPNDATGILVDFGAQDINGSIREVAPKGFRYIGVDRAAGKGVDVVCEYEVPLANESADIVTSTSTLEHVELFWVLFLEMVRITKSGGLIYLNAPSVGKYHACPVDCWRFYPDAGQALERWARHSKMPVTLLHSHIMDCHYIDDDGKELEKDEWNDWVAIFRKL